MTYSDYESQEKWDFLLITESGDEIPCTGLLSFEKEGGVGYLLYIRADDLDEEGDTLIHAGRYDPAEEPIRLAPVETDQEYKALETLLHAAIRACQRPKPESESVGDKQL